MGGFDWSSSEGRKIQNHRMTRILTKRRQEQSKKAKKYKSPPFSTTTTNATYLKMGNILCFLFGFCLRFEVPTFPAAAPVPVVVPPADINDESVWHMTLDLEGIPANAKPYYQKGGDFWATVIKKGVPNVDLTGQTVGEIPDSKGRCTIPQVIDDIVSTGNSQL